MIFFVVTVSLTHIHWNRVKSWRLYLRAGYGHAKKASFSELYHLKDIVEYNMEPLEIKRPAT